MDNDWTIGVTDYKDIIKENYTINSRVILKNGLVNQLNGLFGMILIAKERGGGLLLPDFESSVNGGKRLEFEKLFDRNVFKEAMKKHDLDIEFEVNNQYAISWKDGWIKLGSYQKLKESKNLPEELQKLEEDFYKSLKPSQDSKWGSALKKYERKNPKIYGAIHPRIEKDWKEYCKMPKNRHKLSPSLKMTFDRIKDNSEIDDNMKIFVSVGADINKEDEKELKRDNVFTIEERVSSNDSGNDGLSYTESSLLSLFLCKNASWFVGCSSSTFSRLVSKYRDYDGKGSKWYHNGYNELEIVENGQCNNCKGYW